MFDGVISAIDKLLSEFSWKKLFTLLIVIAVVVLSLIAFDYFTKYFTLLRLEKEIALFQEVSANSTDSRLTDLHSSLIGKLSETIKSESTISGLFGISGGIPLWFYLSFSMAAPWLLVALAFIPGIFKKEANSASAVVGLIIISIIFGIIGNFIPEFWGGWVRYLLLPIVVFIAVIVPIAIYGNQSSRSRS
jgi:hypothetical protein